MIDWYHFYLNHPGGTRSEVLIWGICYWKVVVTQAELFAKICKTCQQLKKRKTLYGHLTQKNTSEIKPSDTVHVYLIGQYSKSISEQQPSFTSIRNNDSLTCMTMIDPATG